MRSIGLTSPLNVLTLARHQPLYITLRFEQGPMFLLNSRLAYFSCAPSVRKQRESPYSEVSDAFLPSSLTRVLSSTWGYSPHPPVSVCGTGNISLALEIFLGSHFPQISPCEDFIRSRHYIFRIYLEDPPNHLNAYSQNTLEACRNVIPSDANIRDGILTVCPLSLPFGKDLGPPNPGLTISAQETLGLRWFGFSPNFLLLMPTFSLLCAPPDLTVWLHCTKNAPLPTTAPHFVRCGGISKS